MLLGNGRDCLIVGNINNGVSDLVFASRCPSFSRDQALRATFRRILGVLTLVNLMYGSCCRALTVRNVPELLVVAVGAQGLDLPGRHGTKLLEFRFSVDPIARR